MKIRILIMNWVVWTEFKINISCESLCEKNIPKWEKIRKNQKNENPFGSRGSVCLEEFRKLGGKFFESIGRPFESGRAHHFQCFQLFTENLFCWGVPWGYRMYIWCNAARNLRNSGKQYQKIKIL